MNRIIFQPRIALASQISDENDGSRIYICVCVPPPCSGSVLPIYLNGIFFIWIEYVESRTSYYIPSSANRQSFPRYQEIALDRYIYFFGVSKVFCAFSFSDLFRWCPFHAGLLQCSTIQNREQWNALRVSFSRFLFQKKLKLIWQIGFRTILKLLPCPKENQNLHSLFLKAILKILYPLFSFHTGLLSVWIS